ncbi:cation transporter [Methylophilus sp.]|uniref:cation transporter n=1 Tax=Methylophilus sp. TaxID=29541 RepID=UPI0040366F4D
MNNKNHLHLIEEKNLRTAVILVAIANLTYFFVEFGVAKEIGSVSLFADSIDFLEDASVNLLIALALGWSLRARAKLGKILALIILVPALSLLWTAWQKFNLPTAPDPWLLSLTGFGALVTNLACAFLLAKYRFHSSSLTRAAFLSARNDAFANIAIITAGIATINWLSGWPDLVVGIGIAVMNADAAKEVWMAAKLEHAAMS